MKRAFVIVTDADYVFVTEARVDRTTQEFQVFPTEQVLKDLNLAVDALNYAGGHELRAAASRINELLPQKGDSYA